MKAGILGGTFDPIHLGHLAIAEEARTTLGLEEVIFIPTGLPWMKIGRHCSSSYDRLTMVRLAVASNPFFRVSPREIERTGPSYTVDTLRELHQESSGHGNFYFILGIDSLKGLVNWKEPQAVLDLATIVAVTRPGFEYPELCSLQAVHPSASRRIIRLDRPVIGISGTDIRRRVAEGLSVRYQVPEAVEAYMYRNGLYLDREVRE